MQLAFRVPPAAIIEWHETLRAYGVEILRGPTEIPDWRHETLFFRDPEGNILELYAEI
ncbi:VOC family protein [Roseobacter weihaiensis]|uniref:VOC family protein n=1 Tax=Roseobacter weihaiensis TaxID=2763262 RepID=UPI001D0BCF3A|nr:VOC family protein [Roseobacter sp. H9]